jgi:hypothetical protein
MEEIAIVRKVRFDDETGADMYDVEHKYVSGLWCKWIRRDLLRHVLKEGDAEVFANLEKNWRNQIRKQREAEERKIQREKTLKIANDLEKMNQLSLKLAKSSESVQTNISALSNPSKLLRGRLKRTQAEEQEIRDELDRSEGKQLREETSKIVERMKQTAGLNLSRADVLSLTKSVDLKLNISSKINKRRNVESSLNSKRCLITVIVLYLNNSVILFVPM